MKQHLFSPTPHSLETRKIFDHGFKRRFIKKSVIFHQGDDSDSVYWIELGKVKVYVTDESGRVSILRYLGTGEVFGELGAFDHQARSATVEAVEDSLLIVVTLEKFRYFLGQNQVLLDNISQQLSSRVRDLTSELITIRHNNTYCCFRTKLYDLTRQQADGTFLIPQKFTQEELGEFVGTTRQNINRFIKGLKQGGYLLENNRGELLIVHPLPLNW